jgi:lysophospholipid acyltransferase (LPLAT)-like uncharacterized protein
MPVTGSVDSVDGKSERAGQPGAKARSVAGKPISKRVWHRIRDPLKHSRFVKGAIATILTFALRFIHWTNPWLPGVKEKMVARRKSVEMPVIIAMWHGQHLMAPFARPSDIPIVALVSRSADAEMNALVANRLGMETIRGSGGRGGNSLEKGGARALLGLKMALAAGKNAAMIADIPNGTPREAGLGIVTLAKISGRPIVPLAYASSRRKVLEKTWDKTTLALPFGRATTVVGDPIHVAADADAATMEALRVQVTEALNTATREAYAAVDG